MEVHGIWVRPNVRVAAMRIRHIALEHRLLVKLRKRKMHCRCGRSERHHSLGTGVVESDKPRRAAGTARHGAGDSRLHAPQCRHRRVRRRNSGLHAMLTSPTLLCYTAILS